MVTNPSPDIVQYCNLMEEIKLRINVFHFLISGQGNVLYQPPTLESACLQLRKILELIAFGSLVANKDAYTAVYAKASKKWAAGDILKELEQINADFYPVPIIEIPSNIPGLVAEMKKREGDFLAKSDFAEVYGRCGVMAHAANPFGKGIDYACYRKKLPLWGTQVINLLNSHQIHLVDTPGFYVVHMYEKQDGKVHWYRFVPTVDPQ